MDKMTIEGLECYGYHGVFAEENKLGQRYQVDLQLTLDLRRAGISDDLTATVDYAEIVEKTRAIVEGEPVKLIERLAELIAEQLLADYPLLQEVLVSVKKLSPPVAIHFSAVAVHVERKRGEHGG